MITALHPQYITDEGGKRVSVVLPMDEYTALLEDLDDLATLAERRDEPCLAHEEVVARLKSDGLL
jgi:hypothetical protein